MGGNLWAFVAFNVFVVAMLALDLGVLHKKERVIGVKEALGWSAVWIGVALAFAVGVYTVKGSQAGIEFVTGYLIEKSLSIDNVFVIVMIFSAFQIDPVHQHRVLFWGILGALVMRAIFIFTGVALISKFHWMLYVFGALLVFTGIKMALPKSNQKLDPERTLAMRLLKKIIPVTPKLHGSRFFVVEGGRRFATPLFAALLLVEGTDLIFAVDSIPAILAITDDPFIVYTSNVFAILGMRSLYFALAGISSMFRYIHFGLAAVLVFVGTKMVLVDVMKVPAFVSLAIVASLIGASMLASVLGAKGGTKEEGGPSPTT
ncbi:MAG: TerC family protein [Deltaproteobacteria bacterium]|nr:TerC family protein [Deltaproteobacteria bacterium]